MGKRKSQNPRKIIPVFNDDSDSDISVFENKFVGKETYKINESNKLGNYYNRPKMREINYRTCKTNTTAQPETVNEEEDLSFTTAKRLCNTITSNCWDEQKESVDTYDSFSHSTSTKIVFPDMIKSGILTTVAKRSQNSTMVSAKSTDKSFQQNTNGKTSKLIENCDTDDPLDLSVEQSDSASDDSWHNKDKVYQSMGLGNFAPKRRNQTYPPTFKIAVVQYAEKHGVMAAARYYDVSPKRVRVWRTGTMKQTIMKKIKKQGLDVSGSEAGSSTQTNDKSHQLTLNKDKLSKTETKSMVNETENSNCALTQGEKYCCVMKEKTTETQNRTIPVWEVELFANLRKQLNSKNSIRIKKLLETAKKMQPLGFQTEDKNIPTLWIVQWCVKFGVGFETNKCCEICAIPKELSENIVIRKVKPGVAGQGIVEKPKKLRKTYSPDFKLQVAEFALRNTQRAAARKFGVAQKRVFSWVLAKDELEEMWLSSDHQEQELKQFPEEIENIVWKWYTDMQSKGKDVTKRMICAQARFQFKRAGNNNFIGNNQWYNSWIRRMKTKGLGLDFPSDDNMESLEDAEEIKNINESGCS